MEPEKDVFEEWAEEIAKKPWIVRKIQLIPIWWNNDGKYLYRNFIIGIKNIIYWLPIIWKDRNWDSHYIFEIMKHKLKAQSKYIGERDIHTRAKRDAEVMMTCVRLMEKVQDEFYSSEYMDYHKTKHWFEPVPGNVQASSWESKLLEENFNEYFAKYPLIYKRVLNGEGIFKFEDVVSSENKQRIAMNIAHINHKRARKLLFKLMEENIEGWWD
jgi:hypothetical protein